MSSESMIDKAGKTISDTAITAKVKGKYVLDDILKSLDVHVKTENGEVTLSGNLNSRAEKERAIELATEVEGVKRVEYMNK